MGRPLLGAIEAGGTKFVCAVGPDGRRPLLETTLPTTTPEATLDAVVEFFAEAERRGHVLDAFGIATFGPVELDPASPAWGRLLATPKPGWSDVDLVRPLRARFRRPIAIDTDVNAAALAEAREADGIRSLSYVTVGTGIGGGAISGGRTITGLMHPEMGHLHVQRAPDDVAFAGVCPFHGDCLEGLASGPAIVQRWGAQLDALPDDHPALPLLGDYLGQLAATLLLVLSSERVVFGGGVMSDGRLLPHVREATLRRLGGYLRPERLGDLSTVLVPPTLGSRAGIVGAFELATRAAGRR
jgi:fructokinase